MFNWFSKKEKKDEIIDGNIKHLEDIEEEREEEYKDIDILKTHVYEDKYVKLY